MEKLEKKIESLENEISRLRDIISQIGTTDIHNFTVLDKKVDEKIKSATKEIIEAINKK